MSAIAVPLRLQRERNLRSRAARGDSAAFAAVYERYHQALYRYCRSIVRHEQDAQDALQSTMTRAYAALQDEQRDFELRPWLFRIAHNEAISILRRPATRELEDSAALADPLEERVAQREELRLLRIDLADLPERQRAALVLRELNGLSHAEIGVVLDVPVSAVKQAIFDARSALVHLREGRETACVDIERMLSDGDGRVLRGRGVRGHLRACPSCRRFRADLVHRPAALRALLPPLPVGSAAALLAQVIGGGTAVKLLACIAIVGGGGATLATEMRAARQGARPAEASAEVRQETRRRPPRTPAAAVPAAATSTPQPRTVLVSDPPKRAERSRAAETRAAQARAAKQARARAAKARAKQARAAKARAAKARAKQARAVKARAAKARAKQARAVKARAAKARAKQARAAKARAKNTGAAKAGSPGAGAKPAAGPGRAGAKPAAGSGRAGAKPAAGSGRAGAKPAAGSGRGAAKPAAGPGHAGAKRGSPKRAPGGR